MADETRSTSDRDCDHLRAATGPIVAIAPRRPFFDVRERRPRSGRPRRRTRRRPQVFPAQEGLQVLRRKDRGHQLQGHSSAGAVRGGKRQDRASTPDRCVHTAPAASCRRRSSRRAILPCCRLPAGRRKKTATDMHGSRGFVRRSKIRESVAARILRTGVIYGSHS